MLATTRRAAPRRRTPALYAFLLLASAPALHAQDPFEPNDSCLAPSVLPLPLGLTTGLTLGPDEDCYVISVPANAWIEISAVEGVNNVDVELWEFDCLTMLAASVAAPLSYADCGGAMRNLVVRVPAPVSAIDLPYELTVNAVPIVDDSFEPNDSCTSGVPSVIRDYAIAGLVVTRCSEDWWAISVQPNNYEIQIEAIYDGGQAGLDLELFDEFCTSILSSTTTLHGKALRFVNMSGTSQVIKVRVSVTPGGQRVAYALSTCFGGASFTPLIGHQACVGVPNSTGKPAGICAWGSTDSTLNNVNLYIGDLPASSFGYFIASQTYQFIPTPGNTMGNLCLGAPGRYSFNILNSGAGWVPYMPQLPMTPLPGGGFTSVQPGQTWYWQYWYRDAISGVATSNFSSALYIQF